MTPSAAFLAVCFLAAAVFESPAAAQAVVEYGLGAGRAATTTAPAAKGIGSSMSGIAGALDKSLKAAPHEDARKAGSPSKSTASNPAPEKAAAIPPAPAKVYEDPLLIKTGLTYDDVMTRFGPPAMVFATGPTGKTLTYFTRAGAVQVECEDGKVASVDKPKS